MEANAMKSATICSCWMSKASRGCGALRLVEPAPATAASTIDRFIIPSCCGVGVEFRSENHGSHRWRSTTCGELPSESPLANALDAGDELLDVIAMDAQRVVVARRADR